MPIRNTKTKIPVQASGRSCARLWYRPHSSD
jgi:hypothetical protein